MKIKLIGLSIFMWLVSGSVINGEALPLKPGTVDLYTSQNTRYTVEIEILGYPDSSPSQCTFKDSGKTVWSKLIPATPSKVVIADNGRYIAMTNWGWYDEGASRSLSIYNCMGDLIAEIPFGGSQRSFEGLKWVKVLAIAPDGSYCAVGTAGKEHALFAIYDCRKAELFWEKEYGFPKASAAELSDNGEYILIATDDYQSLDMCFLLLNHQGDVLYQKNIPRNYSWDVPDYLAFKANGHEFGIYDCNSGNFLFESIP